ncbi:hypothetical protein EMGBS3_08210 [Anaerolineaceae bacterium]|nr:hypothetical protein EMGBS3_08210 [Anaerolineaceae bacterium]
MEAGAATSMCCSLSVSSSPPKTVATPANPNAMPASSGRTMRVRIAAG